MKEKDKRRLPNYLKVPIEKVLNSTDSWDSIVMDFHDELQLQFEDYNKSHYLAAYCIGVGDVLKVLCELRGEPYVPSASDVLTKPSNKLMIVKK